MKFDSSPWNVCSFRQLSWEHKVLRARESREGSMDRSFHLKIVGASCKALDNLSRILL